MAECMWMNDTPEEFIKDFSFVDSKQVYTNGAELISVLRVKQMLEHYFREVEPVVHAHWICDCEPYHICSNCRHKFSLFDRVPRCPNCGAHMDEEVADG